MRKFNWIAPVEDFGNAVIYFDKHINLDGRTAKCASLFVCGIGFHVPYVNGCEVSDHFLSPAMSEYSKRCYYEKIDVTDKLNSGDNLIEIAVGQGWRRNISDYVNHFQGRKIDFFGAPQLTAVLEITLDNDEKLEIATDESWSCRKGNIVFNHLFDGETYDARITDGETFACKNVPAPGENTFMCLQDLEPIRVKAVFEPISIHEMNGGYIFDLGQNIAGVVEINIPDDLPVGTKIVLQHAEILDPDEEIYTATLRSAKATDTYIVGEKNKKTWHPLFTYHGFRYVKVTGLPYAPDKKFLRGLQFYTDIDSGSSFRCGSGIVNEIHKMIVMTERANLHSITTDCPQRDERNGWMNDATVRYEELPYNFNASKLFPKIIRDIMDTQVDGAIADTAPYIYGHRPADPVCSSFLIAGLNSYLFYGDTDILREAYPAYCEWNECIARNCEDGIVNYSYWGDWAGPEDCCLDGTPKSAITPGVFMSTGYHYYNYKLLAYFASVLGKEDEVKQHEAKAEAVKKVMLDKWMHDDGTICTGTQACQAFALKLGIIPEELKEKAAKRMNDAVIEAGMRITTGNLCTLYLMEMLSEYGYIDTAWELMTREEYPSWGFMLQNGATTIWERYELKKDPGMNSHCHPMYGAVGKWLYSHLVGIKPVDAGFKKAVIRPYIPSKLLHAQANIVTNCGDLHVRWEKTYGETRLMVSVPNGMTAEVDFGGKIEEVAGGTHIFRM